MYAVAHVAWGKTQAEHIEQSEWTEWCLKEWLFSPLWCLGLFDGTNFSALVVGKKKRCVGLFHASSSSFLLPELFLLELCYG